MTKTERDIEDLKARVTALERRCERLTEAIQRGLPHMNLSEYLEDPDVPG